MSEKTIQKDFYHEMDDSLKADVKLSILEGSLSTVMGTFIGGTFLIGFALLLGAGDLEIGLLASLPLFANLIQIAGSFIMAKTGSRKKVCVTYLFLHRLMWAFITMLPLVVFRDRLQDIRVWIFLILLTGASICASITGIAWTSWVADLVPKNIRGRFFARRNMKAQIVGMVMAVAAGQFIDIWKRHYQAAQAQSYGFMILFAIGVLFGIAGVFIFRKISEPTLIVDQDTSFLQQLQEPFKDCSFRMFMAFNVAWAFSVGMVGPFFSVYMIKTLEIPFSTITLFGVVAGLASILGLKVWGGLIDSLGPKPLSFICLIGGSFVPFLWIFATPESYWSIWVSNAVSGFFFAGIGLSATGMMMTLAPSKNSSVYFSVFAAVTGIFGALAPIAGGVLGEFFRGKVLYAGFVTLSDIRILFVASTCCRLLSVPLLRFVSLPDSISLKELFVSISKYQKVLPLYNIQSIAASGLGSVENMTFNMSRSVIKIEHMIDGMLAKGKDLSNVLLFKLQSLDHEVDEGIGRHEQAMERFIDKVIELFKRKKR